MQINFASLVPHSSASMYHDSPRARSYASWLSIASELRVVGQLALRLERMLSADGPLDRITQESLTWHLVLRYGRCFDSTSAGRSAALGPAHVRKLDNADFLSIHQGLIHRRHNTFAHPGGDCSCRITVHLIEHGGAPTLQYGFDEEGPGPINDPDQAALIAQLTEALQLIVGEKAGRARVALEIELVAESDTFVQRLRQSPGKHANVIQQAMSALSRMMGTR